MRPNGASRPEVPGDTEAARMDAAVRMLFKAEYVKQETNDKRTRERKKQSKAAK
jgi:hypothetical protein